MASIRRHPRSPYWIACLTKPNGQRTTRSIKIPIAAATQADRKDQRERAEEIAIKWERAGLRAKKTGLTTSQARAVLNDILRAAGTEEIDALQTRAYLSEWLHGKNKASTRERYSHVVELFLSFIGDKADQALANVTYQDVLGFIRSRRAGGAASKTLSVDAKILNTAFLLARKLSHIETNPVEHALALEPIAVESSTKEVFTPEQISALAQTATGDWRTAILLGYYTGARLRDCTNLQRHQIDFEHGVITIRQGKTGDMVWIPIHPDLDRQLRLVAGGLKKTDFVCPSLANRKSGGKSGLSREFADIMKQAGVGTGTVPGKGKRRFSPLSFHSLRHSFNTHLANSGVSQEVRMSLTGHATVEINGDYTHLELKKLSDAIFLLPSVMPSPAKK